MDNKKVYLLIKSIAGKAGGAERVTVNIANELSRRGYDITILSYEKTKGKPFYQTDSNVVSFNLYPRYRKAGNTTTEVFSSKIAKKIYTNINNNQLTKLANKIEWYGNNGVFLKSLTSYITTYPPKVLISFLPSSFSVAHLACKSANIKHIVSEHNVPKQDFSNPERWDPNPYDIYLRWQAVKYCDAMTVLFEEFKNWFPSEYHKKIHVVTNYVSPPKVDTKPYLDRDKRIIAVGRLAYPKNHEILIKAWALIYEKFPEWKVEIYGSGPLKKHLSSLIEDLKVQGLSLKGVTDDVWGLYSNSQIFCIPSRFEGFGLVTVEAMMMGLPATGFADCEGTNRIIKKDSGVLVKDMTEYKLAETLTLLMENPELRLKLSNNAEKSVSDYDKEFIIPKWVELIEGV